MMPGEDGGLQRRRERVCARACVQGACLRGYLEADWLLLPTLRSVRGDAGPEAAGETRAAGRHVRSARGRTESGHAQFHPRVH